MAAFSKALGQRPLQRLRSKQEPRRRRLRTAPAGLAAALLCGLVACSPPPSEAVPVAGAAAARTPVQDSVVADVARQLFDQRGLRAAVGQVIQDGEVIAEFALGEAQTGVPATVGDSYRNGAIAIAYLSVAALRLAEQGVLDIEAPIHPYLPDFPEADRITPRQLLSMTSGLPDYEPNSDFDAAFYADPFRAWTTQELLEFGISQPRLFEPGTNWDYSHTGIQVLGEVLARAAGKPLSQVLQDEVLDPAGLKRTFSEQTALIPEPVMHAFTAERGVYEDATFWNPSWTLAAGAVQTTTVGDTARGFDAFIGRGEHLEPASHEALVARNLVGFGEPLEGCRSCHTLDEKFAYGLGVFIRGDYVAQTPLFGGYAASVLTLPETLALDGRSLTVSVAVTLLEDAVQDWTAPIPNRADELAIAITAALRPGQAPPAFTLPRG